MARPSVKASGKLNTVENSNGARYIELERLLAPVCCARWVVLNKSGGEPFVLNDLGLTGTVDKITGEPGWAIPIGKDTILGIFPKRRRGVALYHEGAWWPLIEHRRVDSLEAQGFNNAMAHLATSYVVGANAAVVERLTPHVGEHADVSALMDAWPFDHRTRLAHAKDWHRLLTATADNLAPDELGDLQAIDPAVLASSWCPPVGVLLNVRQFPTGLSSINNVIRLTLDTPADYEGHIMSSAAR
jgi:hypothetical protein